MSAEIISIEPHLCPHRHDKRPELLAKIEDTRLYKEDDPDDEPYAPTFSDCPVCEAEAWIAFNAGERRPEWSE